MKAEMIRSVIPAPVMLNGIPASVEGDDLSMLRSEVEMLVEEDAQLMKIAGAAALFVSQLKGAALPKSALEAATVLANLINQIPDDTMCDALEMLAH